MEVLQGNTSGSIVNIPYHIPCTITSFVLTNKTAGSITVNVYISAHSITQNIDIYSKVLTANQVDFINVPITLQSNFAILIVTTGSLDYYFTLK